MSAEALELERPAPELEELFSSSLIMERVRDLILSKRKMDPSVKECLLALLEFRTVSMHRKVDPAVLECIQAIQEVPQPEPIVEVVTISEPALEVVPEPIVEVSVSPVIEVSITPEVSEPEPVIEVSTPEPIVEVVLEPIVEVVPEPEPVVEVSTPEPVVEVSTPEIHEEVVPEPEAVTPEVVPEPITMTQVVAARKTASKWGRKA